MKSDLMQQGPVTVIRIDGDLDEEGVQKLRVSLLDCLSAKRCNVVLNLSALKFISYMGVGVLVERLRQFRSLSGDLKLVGLNLYTERLFRMVGISDLFETYDTEANAVQVFQEAA